MHEPALLALIQTLLTAREPNEVRAATAHGAMLISPYRSLSLYEPQRGGSLEPTHRDGAELGPGAAAVEALLLERAGKLGTTVSTLDMFAARTERQLVEEYGSRGCLCLARPLHAYGELAGMVVLHYDDGTSLPQAEFEALRRFLGFAAAALSNALTRAELHDYAYSDALTGLANRRSLELELARLQGTEVSLLLIDFDGLKVVNDSLGFDRGDALIQAVGVRLASSARTGESVVRFGGDEFVVVMPETGSVAAVRRAQELTAILDELALPADLATLFQGASVGAATAGADEDLWAVLQRASAEMRSRKRRRKSDRLAAVPLEPEPEDAESRPDLHDRGNPAA